MAVPLPPHHFPEADHMVPVPTREERARHDEAAVCVAKLLRLGLPRPWRMDRMELSSLAWEPLVTSLFVVSSATDRRTLALWLRPERERERAVLAAWTAFSARRLHEDLGGDALRGAAMETLLALAANGALEER
ncbi:MAG TPA: hypothetical protein VFU60_15465 [Ktedonobacterales bacterium]|nr:hypothetical protein [Ktedonobacterales bacterium]